VDRRVRLLLDTHVVLWALRDPARLGPEAGVLIRDRANELFVSAATPWEIATKHRIGKLDDAGPLLLAWSQYLDRLGASELPISSAHALAAGQLDWGHRDPFDRMLAAQSVLDSLVLVTADTVFRSLPAVRTIRAD
jgi:PIN domain nuclease of toxin-antitoxin system